MQQIDFNLSDITTNSLNNLSDLSDSSHASFSATISSDIQSGGGLRSFFFGSSGIDDAVLEAAREKNKNVVEFMINKNLISSYKTQDKDGNTLLHYLVAEPNPDIDLINKILKRSDVKSFINKQNKEGDTPLIAAVKAGQHDLCKLLESAGADKTIKNKKGHFVDTETDEQDIKPKQQNVKMQKGMHAPENEVNIFRATIGPLPSTSSGLEAFASPKEVEQVLKPLLEILNRNKQQETNTSEPASITITDVHTTKSPDTPDFVQNKVAMMNAPMNQQRAPMNETEELIQKIEQHSKTGGHSNSDVTTENLITAIESYFNTQNKLVGGHNGGKISGTRKIHKYSESSPRNDMDSDQVSQKNRQSDLGQLINNQTTDIIERSLKHIKSIIADNKKEFKSIKPDDDTAKAIKSILWKSIREANPEIKSSLDVAVEMEKKINKEELQKINAKSIKDMVDILNKVQKEKKDRKPIDNSATSSEQVPSDSGLSQTSY